MVTPPTWLTRLPGGVGVVGGRVVGAGQPHQPQQDGGQGQERGHEVTGGQASVNMITRSGTLGGPM